MNMNPFKRIPLDALQSPPNQICSVLFPIHTETKSALLLNGSGRTLSGFSFTNGNSDLMIKGPTFLHVLESTNITTTEINPLAAEIVESLTPEEGSIISVQKFIIVLRNFQVPHQKVKRQPASLSWHHRNTRPWKHLACEAEQDFLEEYMMRL